jgi:hypothetical protein
LSTTFDYTVFGVYEIFGNLIPGFILLASLLAVGHSAFGVDPSQLRLPEGILVIVTVFVAFTLGVAIQGFSSVIGGTIQNRKYGGYPSALFLDDNNKTFPSAFKQAIRNSANQKFGTPVDAPASHVFELCYTYVVQKIGSVRVSQFLALYTFSRSMMVTMLIEAATIIVWAVVKNQYPLFIVAALTLGLAYLFYKRFLIYSESFAKEVYRSFAVG